MNGKALYITTSWDDGHPCDLRLAELLARYNIPATFYVPISNQKPVLTSAQIREVSRSFEIGGHTISHCDLTTKSEEEAWREIYGCKAAIETITSKPCNAFCFPLGRFRRRHVGQVNDAGFRVARTVELMSLAGPRIDDGLALMPTTVQSIPPTLGAIVRNTLKRGKFQNLARYLSSERRSWVSLAASVLHCASSEGGIFHLWGHSWEIEELDLWSDLEAILSLISEYGGQAVMLTNSDLAARLSCKSATEGRGEHLRMEGCVFPEIGDGPKL